MEQLFEFMPEQSENLQENNVLNTSSFPSCCGAKVLHSFGFSYRPGEVVGPQVAPNLRLYKKDLDEAIKKNKTMAMLLIAINGTQNRKFGKLIREKGFKEVSRGHNNLHESTIYLYSYEYKKTAKKKAKSTRVAPPAPPRQPNLVDQF